LGEEDVEEVKEVKEIKAVEEAMGARSLWQG